MLDAIAGKRDADPSIEGIWSAFFPRIQIITRQATDFRQLHLDSALTCPGRLNTASGYLPFDFARSTTKSTCGNKYSRSAAVTFLVTTPANRLSGILVECQPGTWRADSKRDKETQLCERISCFSSQLHCVRIRKLGVLLLCHRMMSAYPPTSVRSRAVLVRNIPRLADDAALNEFFSFCGTIESKRMSLVPAHALPHGVEPTFEAIVVFADEASRRTALLMNESSILDVPVSITPVPEAYVPPDELPAPGVSAAEDRDVGPHGVRQENPGASGASSGGIFAGVGGFISGMGVTISTECQKAASMIDAATDSGPLKTAKDHAALARKKTAELIQSVDTQYHVQQRAGAVAGAVSTQTRTVASAVAEQSKSFANQVDSTLHISQHTRNMQEKAMANETVNSGIKTIRSGLDSLLTQTGLRSDANGPGAAFPVSERSDMEVESTNTPPSATG